MSWLTGEYELTLDEKNRLLIPADIRRRLNPTEDRGVLFIKLGKNGVPWLYSAAKWAQIASVGDTGMDPDEDTRNLIHFHFAMTYEIEWDKQGRAVIPERILRRTKIGRELMLVGSADHLELWNRAAWEDHMDAVYDTLAKPGKTRQAQQPQGNT